MNRRQLLWRLSQGAVHNTDFNDFTDLLQGLSFELIRISGSHHVFSHPGIPEILNLQPVKGEAKPYQIRQLLRLVERYNLQVKD